MLDNGQATAFGNVADSYDRVRPGPPADAVTWLVPPECRVAVDIGAGTGLFTRALEGWVEQVIAVEPDSRMREVLAARSPGVRVLAGGGEAIPLPDGCADAVFVSTAWHWLDPARAAGEIARVLKDDGRLGIIWTSRDREQDWVAELDLLRLPDSIRLSGRAGPDSPRTVADVKERLVRHHTVTLPAGAPFVNVATASFGFTRTITVEDTLDWIATNSRLITAEAAEREAGLARSRAALLARSGGAGVIEMPMRSWCWRADRRERPPPSAGG